MNRLLRIIVADDEADMRDYFRRVLPLAGHEVVGVAEAGRELVEQCRAKNPDLVITDIRMADMDGIQAADQISKNHDIPVILISGHHEPELIERAEADHIMAYLVKPIKQADLGPTIAIAMRRFEQFKALRKEAGDLRQALEDRKIIERAKGIMMQRMGLGEQEVFHRLQRLASNRNRKLVEIAHSILAAEETFQALEKV